MVRRVAFDTALAGGVAGWAVRGALEAVDHEDDLHVVLVGPEPDLRATLSEPRPDRVTVVASGPAVDPDRDPAVAVRARRDASVRVATELVAAGDAGALVTVGTTGAAITAALFVLRRLPGVRHPALAVTVVVDGRRLVVVDAGATDGANPAALVRYAELAAELVEGETVQVGLLVARGQPDAASRAAAALLEAALPASSRARYAGVVTASAALGGAVDVLVAPGAQGGLLLDVVTAVAGPTAVRPEALVLGVDGVVAVHTGPHEPAAVAATLHAIGSVARGVGTAA